jgi:hypothetical protein
MTNFDASDYYPKWLQHGVMMGDLPWDKAHKISMSDFLAQYTLHDSYWIGLWAVPGEAPVAVMRWDRVWLGGRIPYPSDPILLIEFSHVDQLLISTSQSDGCIASATSRMVSAAERYALLSLATGRTDLSDTQLEYLLDPTLHHTVITGLLGDEVHVFHRAEVAVLCLDQDGEVILLPDL